MGKKDETTGKAYPDLQERYKAVMCHGAIMRLQYSQRNDGMFFLACAVCPKRKPLSHCPKCKGMMAVTDLKSFVFSDPSCQEPTFHCYLCGEMVSNTILVNRSKSEEELSKELALGMKGKYTRHPSSNEVEEYDIPKGIIKI